MALARRMGVKHVADFARNLKTTTRTTQRLKKHIVTQKNLYNMRAHPNNITQRIKNSHCITLANVLALISCKVSNNSPLS